MQQLAEPKSSAKLHVAANYDFRYYGITGI